ncbi:LPXTG cell wall anchor domain-containing protein [Pannonibacter carbonis]|uniref:LPXTG cell wall anchor domain-containing protein n=1 Tax=Pannonibacter carbonis TaxID=2067569 RepID=UPI0013007758|nr:LPXTG cell wall anchor domain-containing protein [Pannonibacter carbonis]
MPVTRRRRLAAGPSPVSSLAFATLIPVPALAQGTETSQALFTPTVILIGIAGLVIGGVIGFIRRRKEMKK